MVPNQLQQTVADALDVPFPTVAFHARRLREAGFLTKGGRGRSAPSMKASDAARLAFAVIASENGLDSAKVLHDFSTFLPVHSSCTGRMLDVLGGRGANGLSAVEELFRSLASGILQETISRVDKDARLDSGLSLTVRLRGGPRTLTIGFGDSLRMGQCVFVETGTPPSLGYERIHRVFGHTLMALTSGFKE